MKRTRILALPDSDIFLMRDVEVLKETNEVRLASGFRLRNPLSIFPCFFSILRGIPKVDLVYVRFADIHAFLAVIIAKLFKKRSIVVVSGYDVAKVPEINYGFMRYPIIAQLIKLTLKYADALFAVSEFEKNEILQYVKRGDIKVLYGLSTVDCDQFYPDGEKENLVLTVGFIKHNTIKRKGFKVFIKAAELLPQVKFIIFGKCSDNSIQILKKNAPSNVEFHSGQNLLMWYQKAKVYCQLSYYETFGVALAEAMACECVPVVTENGSLREVAGDTGFYVPYGNAELTAQAIANALSSTRGSEARNRILAEFPSDTLRKQLLEEIKQIAD